MVTVSGVELVDRLTAMPAVAIVAFSGTAADP
jgi:hypothetical protein